MRLIGGDLSPVDHSSMNFKVLKKSAMAMNVEEIKDGCTLDPTEMRKSATSS